MNLLLGALVVLGMATGSHRQFDKGVAPLAAVVLVESLGAMYLVLVALTVYRLLLARKGKRTHYLIWTIGGVLVWLSWAFFRVAEYSS